MIFLAKKKGKTQVAQLSQAAACDGLVYSINYNGQNSGTQGYALTLFEDYTDKTFIKKLAGQFPPLIL